MMPVPKLQPKSLFAQKVMERMDELKLSSIDVSDRTGATYQHVRGIVRGDSNPSPYFLRVLCDALQLNFDDMNKLVAVDKVSKKFGDMTELPDLLRKSNQLKRKAS
jgi:hypothetical protein